MSQPMNRPGAAAEQRDQARRRLRPITAATFASGAVLTATASGLAWMTGPGHSASSTSAVSPSSSSPSSSFSSQAQDAQGSLQPPDQLPTAVDGGGGMPQAVTGGS